MIVFTNGCFDLLHSGHLDLLEECRMVAGWDGTVLVGLNSDASVARLKGPGRPIVPQDERRRMLLALKAVDAVFVFDDDEALRELISSCSPGVIVQGEEYRNAPITGGEVAAQLHFVERRLKRSTTSLVERIKQV